MNQGDVKKSVVVIQPPDNPNQNGLGVLCEEYILTCAHHLEHIHHGPLGFEELTARKPGTDIAARFFTYMAASYDFMVLSENPMENEIMDDDAGDIIEFIEPSDSDASFIPLRPAKLTFPDDESRKFSGYFFEQDGVTPRKVDFTVSPGSLFIYMDWDESPIQGSSGGPLMTSDHKLIGIMLGQISGSPACSQVRAIRIDMAMPEYLRQFVTWEEL